VAAVVALVQIEAAREHVESPLAQVVSSPVAVAQTVVATVASWGRSAIAVVVALPGLENDNVRLYRNNAALTAENARLQRPTPPNRAFERRSKRMAELKRASSAFHLKMKCARSRSTAVRGPVFDATTGWLRKTAP
jgi:hypothetical protein